MIHLEGMGLFGCMMAWHLHRLGQPFTWDDNNQQVCAWKASTGAIYPSGDPFDQQNYNVWSEWSRGAAPWAPELDTFTEATAWWYSTKSAPHGLKQKAIVDLGPMRMSSRLSYHFNVQRFVQESRRFFAAAEAAPARSDRLIVSHGFGQRLDHVLWGWSCKVVLEFDRTVHAVLPVAMRPTVYFREGRFIMAYAFAVPDEACWYAGSSLIVQKKPKSLEIPAKFERWRANFERLGGGLVRVASHGEFVEGWRPAAAANDDTALAKWMGGKLVMKPLWNSGVRHAPLLCAATLRELGLPHPQFQQVSL